MKTKNLFWAALSMTAALVMTACSNDDNDMTEAPVAPSTSKTIPYTVTVNDGATTRATVDGDNRTLRFATGDKLYITGTNIQGVLDLQDGGAGETNNVTFSGELTYTGGGSPAANLELTATLVSAQQLASLSTANPLVTVNAAGAVTVNYPTTAYCSSINDAVQKYSNLTGTCEYVDKAFTLTQQTAFLNFEITFEDGTATNTPLTAVVSNGGSPYATLNVTTETVSEKVVAKFVLPVAAGTTLSSATVTMGSKAALAISDATLAGKVYNVKRILVTINQSDWGEGGPDTSFTKDGVTVSAGLINPNDGTLTGGGTFSTTLGNFTKIVVTTNTWDAWGEGWSGSGQSGTWTGKASSVPFSGGFMGMGGQTTIVCTIVPTN